MKIVRAADAPLNAADPKDVHGAREDRPRRG
jgi:hypothetical protein